MRFKVSVKSVGPCNSFKCVRKLASYHSNHIKCSLKTYFPTFPSLFTKKKSLIDKIRFMHRFSANLKMRWSPRFPFSVDIILVTSYIKVLLFPWYLDHIQEKYSSALVKASNWKVAPHLLISYTPFKNYSPRHLARSFREIMLFICSKGYA